jgi:ABC-2 type transport system ATP-binding protein
VIKVENLRKDFGSIKAVDNISFDVDEGEIVGILGPNGAGKTTTMRILTGFIPATAGKASVAGFDVFEDSMRARSSIGYLPESVPLYLDMRVDEYLGFRAGLHDISGKSRKEAVSRALEKCWLTDVRSRIIGTLSKGYRQRVGLADALLHDPPILILDEPTVGLDPNQIRQTRNLIKELGKNHTILISTHILPEVEMVCNRVIIVSKGRVMAQDTPERLRNQIGRTAIYAELRCQKSQIEDRIRQFSGVSDLDFKPLEDGFVGVDVYVSPGADPRLDIFRMASETGIEMRELHIENITLEDVFVHITTSEREVSTKCSEEVNQ